MNWENWLRLVLNSNVVAAVVVGLFGLLTLKMGIAKFASEKWWERKAASYASALEGLHKIYSCSNVLAEALGEGREMDEDYVDELVLASHAGNAEVERGVNIGSFLMTKRAASILRELRRGLAALDEPMPSIDYNSQKRDLVYEAILAMTSEAKNDLKAR